jgi:hypothetical protein
MCLKEVRSQDWVSVRRGELWSLAIGALSLLSAVVAQNEGLGTDALHRYASFAVSSISKRLPCRVPTKVNSSSGILALTALPNESRR